MRRSHSVSETSVGLFAFLDVLMSTMGSLILVLMIVSPKIRQEKMAKAATEAARDIVKVEPTPAPKVVAPVTPLVAPPRETIDLNAKFATRVAELSGDADEKRRTAAEKEQGLTAQRERSEKARAERERLERQLAELRATKNHTLAAVQDLSAEGLKVESELSKRGSRLRKIRDQIAHESTEYAFVAYDGVSGTTRRPILIECADDQIKFPQENITLTSADVIGFTSATNPLLAGAEALLEYWLTHSKPDDPKPYVLLVVRPSGTLAYYRARNLLQRMKTPFGYELLAEDQKLAVPPPDQEAVVACRQAIDQTIAKRDSVFDQVFANGSGLSTRNPWRRGAGGSRSDTPGASGSGNGGKPNSPFDDPFDLTSGGSKGTGKGLGGDSLVASGTAMKGGGASGTAVKGGGASGGAGSASAGAGGLGSADGGSAAAGSGGPGAGSIGSGTIGSGSLGSGGVGPGGSGSGVLGSGALGSEAAGPGGPGAGSGGGASGVDPAGIGSANSESGGGGSNNPIANGANGDSKNGSDQKENGPQGNGQKGSGQKGSEGGNPVASLAGSAGAETVGGSASSGVTGAQFGTGRTDSAFELLPPPGASRVGGTGDGKTGETTAAGELGFASGAGLNPATDSQPGDAALGSESGPLTPIVPAGSGASQPGVPDMGTGSGGLGGGTSDPSESSATASGQPGSSQFSPATADSGGSPGGSNLPGGVPSGGSAGADSGTDAGQSSSGSANDSGAAGAGMPSFAQASDGPPGGNNTKHRWGYSSPQASIGFEHDVTIWIGARAIVVGGQPPLAINRTESIQRLTALVVPALDREARAWGRPPDHLYWVPNVKFVVSPGGNLPYEQLRPVIERHGLVSSVDYCLELESPRQTFQSWVQ
jgi:hypothetical protein